MKKKNRLSTILLVVIFLVGLSILLYPSVSNYVNSLHSTKAISSYADTVASVDHTEIENALQAAKAYNEGILRRPNVFVMTESEKSTYSELLSINQGGVMGYIEIPAIEVTLPIYHGTSESVLQTAVGHLDWSSLPVGGESSHCVLSGHRGLPSAKLFTHLDKLMEGDVFMIRVLDEILTYEVDQILIVEPNDTQALMIEEGQDYCTLVTCTPYGINSHRLLVRGHRIENAEKAKEIRITAELVQIEPLLVASALAVPMLLILLIVLLVKYRKKEADSD